MQWCEQVLMEQLDFSSFWETLAQHHLSGGVLAYKDILPALSPAPSAWMCPDSAEAEPHQSQTPTFCPPELQLKIFSSASSQQQQRRAWKELCHPTGWICLLELVGGAEQEPAAPGAFFSSWRGLSFAHIPQGCKSSWVLERMSKSLLLTRVPLDRGVKISLAAKIHWPCWVLLLVFQFLQ